MEYYAVWCMEAWSIWLKEDKLFHCNQASVACRCFSVLLFGVRSFVWFSWIKLIHDSALNSIFSSSNFFSLLFMLLILLLWLQCSIYQIIIWHNRYVSILLRSSLSVTNTNILFSLCFLLDKHTILRWVGYQRNINKFNEI